MSERPKLSPEVLERLRRITSPTLCNAISSLKVRDDAVGFTGPEIRCIFPNLGTLVGYACTAVIGARVKGGSRGRVPMTELWEHVATIPEPRVLVVHDVDAPRPLGSFWGEVNSNIFRAQGAVGTVTDGGVRDLDEMEKLGFFAFAAEVLVSRAHLQLIDVGVAVEVGGLRVEPGDLLHGDRHGVVSVPLDVAAQVPEAARRVEEHERKIIEVCQAGGFSPEKLMQAFRG